MGTKISDFSSATTLTGSELIPIVQDGSTVKATVAQFSAAAPVQTVAGRTGAVVIASSDVTGFNAAASAAAPVQSVAGRTGTVTLGISDVANLQTSLDGKLSTGGGVISANSSTDALRITQVGTGNALLVEDSANPDSTPFVVDATGNVGIGTSAPTSKLTVSGSLNLASSGFLTFNSSAPSGSNYSLYGDAIGTVLNGPSGGIILFDIANSEKMRIDSVGNVGIGTSVPAYRLSVGPTSNATSSNFAYFGGNCGSATAPTATYGLLLGHNYSNGASEANLIWGQGVNSSQYFAIGKTTGSAYTEQLRIDSSGNVGIGTTSTSNNDKLIIRADQDGSTRNAITNQSSGASAESGIRLSSYGATWDIATGSTAKNSNALTFGVSSSEKVRITSGGDVGIGTPTPASKLEINSAGVVQAKIKNTASSADANWSTENTFGNAAFGVNATGAYVYTSAAIPVLFYTGGSEKVRITSGGDVGIGTSAPQCVLHALKGLPGASSVIKSENTGATTGTEARFDAATGSANSYIVLAVREQGAGASVSEWSAGAAVTGGMYITTGTATAPIVLRQSSTERLQIDGSGNIRLGAMTTGTAAAKVLAIANGTAPTSSPTGGGQLYVENGALKYRGSSGTVTTIANA